MSRVRLLPVVIVAALALFVLKGIGIVTGGGYVLTGTMQVAAAGGGDHGGGGDAPAEAPVLDAGADATMQLPDTPTLEDASPTLDDGAVTLPTAEANAAKGGHDTPAAAAHGEPAPAAAAHGEPAPATAANSVPALDESACQPVGGEGKDTAAGLDFIQPGCEPATHDVAADTGLVLRDRTGAVIPPDPTSASEQALLERLAQRREVLDSRESEIDMRMALVEAAEKRIAERTAALEALEARINAMVDEKRELEEAQFKGLVQMYENMKPKDAAAIFDKLDMAILVRVARALNPRKMAPIMAKMDPLIAKDLTAALAVDQVEPTIDMAAGQPMAELPQIVGQ